MEEEIEYRKLVVRKMRWKQSKRHVHMATSVKILNTMQQKDKIRMRAVSVIWRNDQTAKIISTDSADDEVGMNNTVTVYFEDDDEEETYKIVTTIRGNSLKNLISNESPLGKALLGHKIGDRCEVKVNDNYSYFVEIRKIENTVDDGTDKLRSF